MTDPTRTRRRADEGPPLADRLSALGPVFLEIGHFLALRPDAVPVDEWAALWTLPRRAPPLPWSGVEETVRSALGRPPGEAFDAFETVPIRSEPFAQIHQGQLHGEPVSVKIVRPGVRDQVADAKAWRRTLKGLLTRAGPSSDGFERIADEIEAWLLRRIDLLSELATVQRLAEEGAATRWEYIPEAYPEMSGPTMLVTERTPGLALSDLARPSQSRDTATDDRLSDLGTTPVHLGRVLVSVALAQVVGQSSCQADYAPANIAVLPGGRISFLDFTQYVGHASSPADDQLAYLTAVFDGDLAHMFPRTDREATSTEGDLSDFRRALLRQVGPASAPPVGTDLGSAPLAPPAQFLVDVLRMSGDFGVSLAVGSPTIYASEVAAVRTAQLFDEPGDTTRTAQAYLREARIEAATETVSAAQLERVAASLLALWRDTPGQLHQLMSDLSEGTFALNVRASTSRQSEEHQNRRTRLLAAAILSVSLAVVVAAPNMPRPGGVWLGWPVTAVLAGLYVWILVMWRRLR